MKSQFRFAVIADTHVNPTDDESNSPWAVNRFANRRTREVITHVAAEQPDFAIHLGDMVHPVPGNPGYRTAAERFFTISNELGSPLHLVAGNHDIGDKPVRWAPASPISEQSMASYHEVFGESHYSFDHQGVHVVVVNTMLINSGTGAESVQRHWLVEDLRAHADTRILVFGHYPLYLTDPDEPECYDNVAEPGRGWLLGLFAEYGVEAYFCGHVHNFFYNRYGETDLYVLPSTSFVRHDYSELARVPPAEQYGRDDSSKLGHAIVELYPDGHQVHVVRSDDRAQAGPPPRVSVRDASPVPVGVDMREPWAERAGLPYNGMLDEFTRRRVRNDYPLLALWELGIASLRIPLTDLLDPQLERRMLELLGSGHRFHVFGYEVPAGPERAVLDRLSARLTAFEVVLPPERLGAAAQLREQLHCPVTVSPLLTSAHQGGSGAVFAHRVAHGFDPEQELPAITADAAAFRVGAEEAPWLGVHGAAERAGRAGLRAVVHVTLAGTDPAVATSDAAVVAARVAESAFAAWACGPGVDVFLDTLADVDRGYFPRLGLTDRRHSPTLPGQVFRHLHAALRAHGPRVGLPGTDEELPVAGGRVCRADSGGALLVLPHGRVGGAELADATGTVTASAVDLVTGARTDVTLRDASWGRPTLLLVDRLE